eukprot:1439584-Karenia_brevis.AAC.1
MKGGHSWLLWRNGWKMRLRQSKMSTIAMVGQWFGPMVPAQTMQITTYAGQAVGFFITQDTH